MDPKPWEIEPRLQMECLCALARIIRDVRHEALQQYNPDEGDGPWSLGCRVYERTINIVERRAQKLSWLDCIRKESLYFVMLVNGVPLRFYTGKADEPSARTLRQRFPEMAVRQLALPFDQREWLWRLAVETEDDGSVFQIILAQYDENGNFRYPWQVPISEPIPSITSVNDERRAAAVLDKPTLIPKDAQSQEETSNAG